MYYFVEESKNFSIQSYNNKSVKINSIVYERSFIVNKNTVFLDWYIKDIYELNLKLLIPLLKYHSNIIIIGYNNENKIYNNSFIVDYCLKKNIILEFMSIGSACRTYNILLIDDRHVTLGIIIK